MAEERRHFEAGGAAYAAHRPSYPAALAEALAARAPHRRLAVDAGCGTGQLSVLLGDCFEAVAAADVSAAQIDAAVPHRHVRYHLAGAEALPAPDGAAALVTAAQAAHWFELDAFYAECRRVLCPGGLVALVTYGVTIAPEPIRERFDRFYWHEIHAHWPPGREHVENGYADLPFPFEPVSAPALAIERQWGADALLGYVETWSAVKRARAAGEGALVDGFAADLRAQWRGGTLPFAWPISVRFGQVRQASAR
ncbi:MAG: class I SAM-dependent methyltransferase [Pseudomonadota bacterium]